MHHHWPVLPYSNRLTVDQETFVLLLVASVRQPGATSPPPNRTKGPTCGWDRGLSGSSIWQSTHLIEFGVPSRVGRNRFRGSPVQNERDLSGLRSARDPAWCEVALLEARER
jgi:hypothetical protein